MAQTQEYRDLHKEEKRLYDKERNLKNKDKIKETNHKYYEENKKQVLATNAIYREKHNIEISIINQSYYQKNKEKICKRSQENYRNNKNEISKKATIRARHRRQNDIDFRLKQNISRALNRYLKLGKVGNITANIVPNSIKEYREYIENKFEYWMNWKNQGR